MARRDATLVDCLNCGSPLNPPDRFCSHCGQKAEGFRFSLFALGKEYFDIVFNFEFRVWISFFHLLIPGRLTLGFFAGKRQKYLSPFRIFLIFGVLHFALFSSWLNQNMEKQLSAFEGYVQERALRESISLSLDTLKITPLPGNTLDPVGEAEIKKKIRQWISGGKRMETFKVSQPNDGFKDLEEEFTPIMLSLDADTLQIAQLLVLEKDQGIWKPRYIPVTFSDIYELKEAKVIQRAGIQSTLGKKMVYQELKMLKEAKNFAFFVTGQLIWMVLFTMISIAFLQRLLYFRQPFHYAHHLVYNLHFHAFAFLLISIYLMITKIPSTGNFLGLFFLLILGYQLLAVKKIYRQTWLKSCLKIIVLNGAYFIVSLGMLSLTIMISILRY